MHNNAEQPRSQAKEGQVKEARSGERRYRQHEHARESEDFVRRSSPRSLPIVMALLTAFAIMVLAVLRMEMIDGSANLIFIAASLFLVVIAAVAAYLDRIRNLLFSNEFESALFAGAVSIGVEFLVIVKKNGHVAYCSPGLQTYLGERKWQQQDGLDKLMAMLEINRNAREIVQGSLTSAEPATVMATLIGSDGHPVQLRLVCNPIKRPKGFFVVKALTLPEKVEVEPPQHLTRSALQSALKAVWSRYLEHSPIGIMLLDKHAVVTESNAALRTITHKSKHQRAGWKLADLVKPQDKDKVQHYFKAIMAGDGQENHHPLDINLSAGEESTATLFIHHLDDPVHEQSCCVAYMIDTTEQNTLEQRFVQAQKMQAVGQLAGGIAHDFNNLLTAMIGFCDLLLLRHTPGDSSFADIQQIKQNANRAANLVRQLLAFSRKQTLQPEPADITDTLADLSHLIRRLIGENIELKMNHGRDLWTVKVDLGQIDQVIINLAVNARDAMLASEEGMGGILTIQTSNITVGNEHSISEDMIPAQEEENIQKGDYVLIEVIDTGCGMSRKVMKQVFEPFFTTKDVGAGTGLGLSTVCGIIQQTGGYLYVSSQEHVGTKFSIYLRRHEVEDEIRAVVSDTAPKVQDLTGAGTILLVEDEAPVRMFSSRALQNKGYTVLEASCGEEALELIEERGQDIDIIITDVVMPGITGPAMVKQVMEQYPNIKVIFISGYGEDAFVQSYGSERSFDFLPKPFTLNQLASKVKEISSA